MEEIKEFEKDRKISELKKEKTELEETIINMAKFMFYRNNDFKETIKIIARELEEISKRRKI